MSGTRPAEPWGGPRGGGRTGLADRGLSLPPRGAARPGPAAPSGRGACCSGHPLLLKCLGGSRFKFSKRVPQGADTLKVMGRGSAPAGVDRQCVKVTLHCLWTLLNEKRLSALGLLLIVSVFDWVRQSFQSVAWIGAGATFCMPCKPVLCEAQGRGYPSENWQRRP